MESIKIFLPNSILEVMNSSVYLIDDVEEIRLRAEKPLIIRTSLDEIVTEYIVTSEDILTSL